MAFKPRPFTCFCSRYMESNIQYINIYYYHYYINKLLDIWYTTLDLFQSDMSLSSRLRGHMTRYHCLTSVTYKPHHVLFLMYLIGSLNFVLAPKASRSGLCVSFNLVLFLVCHTLITSHPGLHHSSLTHTQWTSVLLSAGRNHTWPKRAFDRNLTLTYMC